MRILITIIFLGFTFWGYSQSEKLPIKFKANEEAEVWIGKAWDYSYNKLKNPINIEFNGEKLKMYYDSGKIYWEIKVISYERKEKKNFDELEKETYTLKIEDKGIIKYLVIEKSYSYGDVSTEIKIPFVSDTGVIMSYHYFQEF